MSAMRCVPAIALLLLTGCSTPNQEIKRIVDSPIAIDSQTSDDVDFGRFSTWSWLPVTSMNALGLSSGDPGDAETRAVIQDAVEAQLFKRGYRRVETAPDLVMNFYLAVDRISQDQIGEYIPEYRVGVTGKDAKKAWSEGTLIIFAFDARTRQLAWRGSAQAEAHEEGLPMPEREKRLGRAIEAMMQTFPAR